MTLDTLRSLVSKAAFVNERGSRMGQRAGGPISAAYGRSRWPYFEGDGDVSLVSTCSRC
jgi:hypothetical protein